MTPCRRCMSSRGQNTHLALQRFVLSIWMISGQRRALSRPVFSSSDRRGFAWALRSRSAVFPARGGCRLQILRLSSMPGRQQTTLFFDHLAQDVIKAKRRPEADELLNLGDVRHAARHVLESGFVRLIVRNELDRRLAAGGGLDPL